MVERDENGQSLFIVSSVKSHRRLQVPVALAIGQYEALTEEELDDAIADLNAERERRAEGR